MTLPGMPIGSSRRSRLLEDIAFIVGIAIAVLYAIGEFLTSMGWCIKTCNPHAGVPWMTVVLFAGCVLPKTLGRATAGKVWDAIASRVKGGAP